MPVWKHDCEECHYLGTLNIDDGREVIDFYVHLSRKTNGGSYIARTGSDGPSYLSSPIEMKDQCRGLLKVCSILAEDAVARRTFR